MVKLYYTASSCSAASFTSAHIAGLTSIETELVTLNDHKTASGVDFYTINPKGNVPTLVLDDGTVLNENLAVLTKIADLAGEGKLAPKAGTTDYYLVLQALSWVASELHASISGLFNPTIGPEVREYLKARTELKFKHFNDVLLKDSKFLVGDKWTIADAYASVVASWTPHLGIDLATFPNVLAYTERVAALPEVAAAKARIAEAPATI